MQHNPCTNVQIQKYIYFGSFSSEMSTQQWEERSFVIDRFYLFNDAVSAAEVISLQRTIRWENDIAL
jgi:hypothetical protein